MALPFPSAPSDARHPPAPPPEPRLRGINHLARPGHVGPTCADDHRLAPGEVADGDGARLDAGRRRRAGVLRGPGGAALDARRVAPDHVELPVRLGLEVADRAAPGAAALAGRRA